MPRNNGAKQWHPMHAHAMRPKEGIVDGLYCDMCGKELLADEDTRYILKIEIYAAYDPMELTAEDVAEDKSDEMEKLLKRVAAMDARELQDQVYQRFRFHLCPACRKTYAAKPLPGGPAEEPAGTG